MYNPQKFRTHDETKAFLFMEEHPFATLISGTFISHLPLVPVKERDSLFLIGHIARANPHTKALSLGPATAVFHGPHTYITPIWYTDNDVPTWNYSVIHATGTPEVMTSSVEIEAALKLLTQHAEKMWPSGWEYFIPPDLEGDQLARHISAFKIKIDQLEFKNKFNQNRSLEDRLGVIKGLESRTDEQSQKVREQMLLNEKLIP